MFECVECGSREGDEWRLESHISSEHLQWLPYECLYCDFIRAPSDHHMTAHIEQAHPRQQLKMIYNADREKKTELKRLLKLSNDQSSNTDREFGASITDQHRANVTLEGMSPDFQDNDDDHPLLEQVSNDGNKQISRQQSTIQRSLSMETEAEEYDFPNGQNFGSLSSNVTSVLGYGQTILQHLAKKRKRESKSHLVETENEPQRKRISSTVKTEAGSPPKTFMPEYQGGVFQATPVEHTITHLEQPDGPVTMVTFNKRIVLHPDLKEAARRAVNNHKESQNSGKKKPRTKLFNVFKVYTDLIISDLLQNVTQPYFIYGFCASRKPKTVLAQGYKSVSEYVNEQVEPLRCAYAAALADLDQGYIGAQLHPTEDEKIVAIAANLHRLYNCHKSSRYYYKARIRQDGDMGKRQ